MPPEPNSTGQKETFQNFEILTSTFSTTRKNFSRSSGSWHRIWNGTDRELFLFNISDKGIISFLKGSKFSDCSYNLINGKFLWNNWRGIQRFFDEVDVNENIFFDNFLGWVVPTGNNQKHVLGEFFFIMWSSLSFVNFGHLLSWRNWRSTCKARVTLICKLNLKQNCYMGTSSM